MFASCTCFSGLSCFSPFSLRALGRNTWETPLTWLTLHSMYTRKSLVTFNTRYTWMARSARKAKTTFVTWREREFHMKLCWAIVDDELHRVNC